MQTDFGFSGNRVVEFYISENMRFLDFGHVQEIRMEINTMHRFWVTNKNLEIQGLKRRHRFLLVWLHANGVFSLKSLASIQFMGYEKRNTSFRVC